MLLLCYHVAAGNTIPLFPASLAFCDVISGDPTSWTGPKALDAYIKYKRRLLGDLCRCALRSLTCYFEVVTGNALTPGVTAAIQTFGDRINLHPHLHFLVTEGGVDGAGVFHKIRRIDDSRLAEIFAREVLAFLVGRKGPAPQKSVRG